MSGQDQRATTDRRLPTIRNLNKWAEDIDAIASAFAEIADRLRDAARSRRERAEAFDDATRWLAELPREIEGVASEIKETRDPRAPYGPPPPPCVPPPTKPYPVLFPWLDRKDEDDGTAF